MYGKSVISAGMVSVLLLGGCASAPKGPSVQVLPGAGKPFEQFQADQAACNDYARHQIAGQVEEANTNALGTAVIGTALGAGIGALADHKNGRGAGDGAAVGAGLGTAVGLAGSAEEKRSIQHRYDMAYVQCMSAKGHQVPQRAPVTVVQPVYAQPPAVIYAPPPTVIYTNPPSGGYAPPPGAIPAPPNSGYAPPPGAVAPPPNQPPPMLRP
jgi:hypothetical protein